MMWFLLLLTAYLELVIIQVQGQGEDRLILRQALESASLKKRQNPCEGYVEIYHEGELRFVGDRMWNNNTGKVVCSNAHCGELVESSRKPVTKTIDKVWLDDLKCNGKETELWNCKHDGWGARQTLQGHLMKVTCSANISISLDGPHCAGAVRYTNGKTSGYFCADNWNKQNFDSNRLCEFLDCGTAKDTPEKPWMVWKDFEKSDKMMIKCPPKEVENLWQCATPTTRCDTPASVICSEYKRLQLKGEQSNVCSGELLIEENGKWNPPENITTSAHKLCQQMHCGNNGSLNGNQLNCTDNIRVVLTDDNKPSRCYGTVHIEVNGKTKHPVCASNWNDREAEVVCEELKCGTVIDKKSIPSPNTQGIMDNVKCFDSDSSLWHCHAKHDRNLFRCDSYAYVVCSESVNVTLVDGPGRCAGRVEIKQEGQWKRVNKEGWKNSDIFCSQMECGTKASPIDAGPFSSGSGDFLQECKTEGKRISKCERQVRQSQGMKALGITCEDHKTLFLKGGSCSGQVQVTHGSKSYWLSGSEETWKKEYADQVCRQTRCGSASNHSRIESGDMMKDVWGEAYNCASKNTSLFECDKKLPPDHNRTIATVNCTGQFTVNLSDGCRGEVNVCENGTCGRVCDDTWTTPKYNMLCQNLGCGDRALSPQDRTDQRQVLEYISVHSTDAMTNLTQYKFISNENKKTCLPARTICSGSIKSRITDTRDKCSGNVEVFYEDKWLPVCKDALEANKNTQNTICAEHGCGKAHAVIDYFGPTSAASVISAIKCSQGNKLVKECEDITHQTSCSSGLGGLQCSGWKKVALKASTKACSGAVTVCSQMGESAVSFEGWTETEGAILCKDLNCGSLSSSVSKQSDILLTTNFNCAGVKERKTIWDCEKQTKNPTDSSQQLFITCQGEPSVHLSKKCGGELKINNIEVCGNDESWKKYSKLVCQEKEGCGNYIDHSFRQGKKDEKYLHVSCDDTHFKLGQCKRFEGKCDKLVSVYCTGNVTFRTTKDGVEKDCGGQIEVNYGDDNWKKVCPPLSDTLKHKLCQALPGNCIAYNQSIQPTANKKKENLETTLSCNKDIRDIQYCVRKETCNAVPAEIYCDGYKIDPTPPPVTGVDPVPIILGIGFPLVLLILIVVFIRICIFKKAKNAFSVSRMPPQKEEDFESGDYDEVTEKANEMEDLSRDRFISESEVIGENDARSTSSYDDIEESVPLTSQAAVRDGDPDESADGVSYEVEDPQANYDDIDAPAIVQTEAEVHTSPQTTPESEAAAKPELVEGDDDYLVPGQEEG